MNLPENRQSHMATGLWLCLGVLGLLITAWLSLKRGDGEGLAWLQWPGADKLAHALVYACLMWWWQQRLHRALALGLLLGFGAVMELIQAQLAWRDGSWLDLLANLTGLLLAAVLARNLRLPFIAKPR